MVSQWPVESTRQGSPTIPMFLSRQGQLFWNLQLIVLLILSSRIFVGAIVIATVLLSVYYNSNLLLLL